MNRSQLDNVINFVNRILSADSGGEFECIDVEWVAHERILRLYIDYVQPVVDAAAGDQTLTLSDCVRVSKLIVDLDELDELIAGQYTLEVSSPGVERPLRFLKHFKQHIGETIQVKLSGSDLARRNGKGRLVDIKDDQASGTAELTLETDSGPWTFDYSHLHRAQVVYNWDV